MEPKIFYLSKASRTISDQEVQEVHLKFCKEVPHLPLREMPDFYNNEAEDIFDNLVSVLPGGVIDRLLVKLLQHKASLFKVSYGDENG